MSIQQFSQSLPIMLYRALDTIMPRFREVFIEFGLTEQQWRVLRVLWEVDEVALKELAVLTVIPAPSLVGIIDRLSKASLVERRRSDKDRRNVFVSATLKGQALKDELLPRVQDTYLELKRSIDGKIWGDMLQGLHELSLIDLSDESLNTASTKFSPESLGEGSHKREPSRLPDL